MKNKIKEIIIGVEMTTIDPEDAANKLFDLFSSSLKLPTEIESRLESKNQLSKKEWINTKRKKGFYTLGFRDCYNWLIQELK